MSCGVSPGPSRLLPNSSDSDQLTCLPEPLTPANGFSCSRHARPVLGRHAAQRFHRHHLVVGRHVGVLEHRRELVLARRHLVVPRLHRHADLVELGLDFGHAGQHPRRDGAEILVFHLLALRRRGAEERPAGVDEIGPGEVEVAIDQEVLLLGPAGREHALGGGAEQLQHPHRFLGHRFHRAQQRRLLVERLSGPADERGRDHQRDAVAVVEQPRRAGRIPGGVAARLEGGAHAARREAGRIGLALDQFLAAELCDGGAVAGRRQERVVLFGRDAGQRLEPVRVVRRVVLDRPLLQRRRHRIGRGRVERLAPRDRRAQRPVGRLRQAVLLDLVAEHQTAEGVGGLDGRGGRHPSLVERPLANTLDGFRQCGRSHRGGLSFLYRVHATTHSNERCAQMSNYARLNGHRAMFRSCVGPERG